MQDSLETSITLPKPEIRTLNFSTIMRIEEIIRGGVNQLHESLKSSSSTDGSFIVEEIQRKLGNIEKNRAEKLKKPITCKLTGELLVKEYYKMGEVYLTNKKNRIVSQQENLKFNKKHKCAEFDKNKPQYYGLNDSEIKKKRDEIYRTKEEALNKDLEKTKKQYDLWSGNKTFTQNVEKKGTIKKEDVFFP